MAKKPEHKEDSEATGSKFVSVIYFHGMGSQRRYEETSRLIDAMDIHLTNTARRTGTPAGRIRDIRPRSEPSAAKDGEIVTYIRTLFSNAGKDFAEDRNEVRFYEVYWAPVMAGNDSAWNVLKWMFGQVLRPWRTVRSRWRERQRLRRSALVELMEHEERWPRGTLKDDFRTLLLLYDDFEGPEARRDHAEGLYDEFVAFVREEHKQEPAEADRLVALSQCWLDSYRRQEISNGFALATIALALLLAALSTILAILWVLQIFAGFDFIADSDNPLFKWIASEITPTWVKATGFAVSLATLLGITRFLTDYMGDVESWATYEETDIKYKRRDEVLCRGIDMFRHVLADDRCERAIVVSHSLGTTVAHDTLLAVARMNKAFNAQDPISGPVDLGKIRHFVTIASPIDKIEYFFESYSSAYHRYKRVVETLRGDIGDVPFVRNRKPHIHWVNFWDRGDIIGGPLHSPSNSRSLANRVDNFHVVNYRFPDPGGSHSAYFNNRTVIGLVQEMIYLGKYGFHTLKAGNRKPPDYESVYLGPGRPHGPGKGYFALALALPWFAAAGALCALFGAKTAATVLFSIVALGFLILAVGYVGGRRQTDPI